MAREHANNGRIYRAVIVKAYVQGRTSTTYYGPYDTAAPAKGLITRAGYEAAASHGKYRNPHSAYTVAGHIESAEVVWMRETG